MFFKVRHIHFVGIGGIGMSGIAEVLVNLGYAVTGSDLREGATVRRLRELGAQIQIGHTHENVEGAHVVVVSSAVKDDNPEVIGAVERSIPVIPRAEMLAELMRMKYGLAVAGAHGKTTTTSMLATIVTHAGLDPTVVIGGKLSSLGSNAKLGQGPYLVAEADESDGSFLMLSPTVAIVTNIDPEHLDHYGDIESIRAAFLTFINKVPFFGAALLCLDNKNVQMLLPHVRKRYVTYGLSHQAELRPDEVEFEGCGAKFAVYRHGEKMGYVHLNMPGMHNILNAVAAIGAAMELEVPFEKAAEALQGFTGVARRFQIKGEVDGISVIDDYAHHPTELQATLEAARKGHGTRRIIAVFQPHRYTRTRDLLEAFSQSFHQADILLMTDIYAAGEAPIDGISTENLQKLIKKYGHRRVYHTPNLDDATAWLDAEAKAEDVILTLGAGTIWRVGEDFIRARGGHVTDPYG